MEITDKIICIQEFAGIARSEEYVRVAVPCALGELQADSILSVIDQEGQPRPSQLQVLKQWPDGSIKWLLVDLTANVPAGSGLFYRLARSVVIPPVSPSALHVTAGAATWHVDTGIGQFTIDARTFRPFLSIRRQKDELISRAGSSCLLSADGGTNALPVVDSIYLEDSGPLRVILRLAGRFLHENGEGLRYSARLHFFAGSMAVQCEFTIHNPQPAKHPGGLWDLGDFGSVLFKELAFTFPFAPGSVTEVSCSPETGSSPLVASGNDPLCIYQESSGGDNWRSPNHRNREGVVPLSQRGYVVELNGQNVASGLRASPSVWCGAGGKGVAAALSRFWQEFPNAIEADSNLLKISLFPGRFPDLHELQGGEQKTQVFSLDFDAQPDSLVWVLSPLQATVSPENYRTSGIFLDLPGEGGLVDQFASATDILHKREVIDEYGWRNFGEVYADHEAALNGCSEPFVSHYNNQYDFISGAYRKYFASGDPKWGEIAVDLACHVRDIDIYHTNQDREEYNQGLFWHTDHYIAAGLSTHRSFSREQIAGKDPRFCGGGPGPEHCYTTGLMLHYYQTGNPDFKQTVIDLAEWVLRALNGSQAMLAALKRGVEYLRLWKDFRGMRRPFPHYPLTRGTGNAITACLDAFEVSGERKYLESADQLIRGTIHPGDDIAARNLLDAEVAWSYTVLLVAVGKFLDKKSELGEFDTAFANARSSLIAYVEWMVNNEYPYLDKPEILEYPNETWAAQDLRKSLIFFHASRYAQPDRQESYKEKGDFFFANAREELHRHKTSRFSRPLVLMLQNGWAGPCLHGNSMPDVVRESDVKCISGRPISTITIGAVFARITSSFMQSLAHLNIQRELAWLRARLDK